MKYVMFLFAVIVIASVVADRSATGDLGFAASDERLSPEEAGYFGEYGTIYATAAWHAQQFVRERDGARTDLKLGQVADGREDKLHRHVGAMGNTVAKADQFVTTIPPSTMRAAHGALLSLVQAAKGENEAAIESAAVAFVRTMTAFKTELGARKRHPASSSKNLSLVFFPLGSPVGVSTSGAFRVELNVRTPVGYVSVEREEVPGVRRLVIRYGGHYRFFRVDRPFEVHLPASLATRISGDGQTIWVDITPATS